MFSSRLMLNMVLRRGLCASTDKTKTPRARVGFIKSPPKAKQEVDYDKPYTREDPYLRRHPNGINPETGEVGGPAGPEPTRFGDWERKGRTIDF